MSVTEASLQPGSSDKAGPLIESISQLSGGQLYTFDLYQRLILPIDGFIFWVRASALSPEYTGAFNTTVYQTMPFNGRRTPAPPLTPVQLAALTFSINGSLHVSQTIEQDDDETYTRQMIAFTTSEEINDFARLAPDQMFILTIPNGSKVAFGSQRNQYQNAGLWTYHGMAVYPALATQIVDDPRVIHPELAIVSDSLPLWLQLSTPEVPVVPAFLSPLNLLPPYITADVRETTAIASAPLYDPETSQTQLVLDEVRFTMYGLNNNAALDFQMALLNGSLSGIYGISSMPVPVDDKSPQREFQVIAQKKAMALSVNYYQSRVREIAQRYITSAFINLTPV